MGLPVCRKGDLAMGHGCWPPHNTIQGSEDVFVEGLSVFRSGDDIQPHSCCGTHKSYGGTGSPTVFVNGKAIQRVSDKATGPYTTCGGTPAICSSVMMTGASTVKAG